MTFAAPLFLIAMLAGGIPVLLHMINRQQAPITPFPTLRFLRVAVERTRKRKYLHDILLLALRVAALILIAVALARPMLSQLRSLFGKQSASIVVIVDNSASMTTKDQPGQRWDTAVHAAEQILDQLRDGDVAALVLACGPQQPGADRLLANHEVLRQVLAAARPAYERADLAARIRDARHLLSQSQTANREIYVVTDMQAASWEALKSPSSEEPAPTRDDPPVLVIDTHGAPLPNVGLRTVSVEMAAPVVGVSATAKVTVVGDALVRQQRHLELLIDGQSQQVSPTLALEPEGTAEFVFSFQLRQPGIHRGEVRIVGEDACPADDRLHFAITVDPNIPVAIVKARQHEIAYLDDAYYLERALTPTSSGDWAIKTTTLAPSALAAENLDQFAVIYCVNLPALDPPLAQRLVAYVRRGGHVVWIAGENVQPSGYNGMNELVSGELLPAPLATIRERMPDRPDGWRITTIDGQHPALAPLASPTSLYQSVLVSKHIQLAPAARQSARVLAALDDGEPILVERNVGDGSIWWWGSSAHVDWSNWPLRPIFLPLLARLTFHLAGTQSAHPQWTAGAPFVVPLAGDAKPAGVEIVNPAGDAVRLAADAQSPNSVRFTDTHQVGVYRVQPLDPQQGRPYGVAANLDPGECAPAVMPHGELEKLLGRQPVLFADSVNDVATAIQRMRQGESLMEVFLVGLLIALVAEVFVANRRIEQDDQRAARRHRPRSPRTLHRGPREFLTVS